MSLNLHTNKPPCLWVIAFSLLVLVGSCGKDDEPPTWEAPEVSDITVPEGFVIERAAEGLKYPTSIAYPPDGSERLFVNELQSGKIRIIQDGELLDEPFAQVETNVSGGFPVDGENGLIGITFDPDYITNRYVYITYAVRTESGTVGKVARFTDNNNKGEDFTVLLDGIPSSAGHQIESLAFGPDGKLYVSSSDAWDESKVQDPHTFNGKFLRMNKDGSIPDDNPYEDSYTYATGFRNCYDFVFRPNGDLLTTENGPEYNDEFNVVMRGENYGWPHYLGEANDDEYVDPIYVWDEIVAPTGMVFYDKTQFPEKYRGKLFMVYFGHTDPNHHTPRTKRIVMVTLEGEGAQTQATIDDFVVYTQLAQGNPIDITVGPDGSMYLSDFFQGMIFRIRVE